MSADTDEKVRPARAVRVIDPAHAEDLRRAMADLSDEWKDLAFSDRFIRDVSRVLAWWGSLPGDGTALTGEVERLTAMVAELADGAQWYSDGDYKYCFFCDVPWAMGVPLDDQPHTDACLWRRARDLLRGKAGR